MGGREVLPSASAGSATTATNTAQIILMDESLKPLSMLFDVALEYNANLKTLMTTTFVPGLVSLGSVFFLGAGNATALLLFNLSMIAGLVNAVWPALQNLDETVTGEGPAPVTQAAEEEVRHVR